MPEGLKIYFAGSIRGGRDDQALYHRLIDYLGRYGEVLTEHVGDSELGDGEKGLTDAEVCERDLDWLSVSDAVVAEVSTPSLGVGYEIGKAEGLGKPLLCLYRERPGQRLSAMLAGNKRILVKRYKVWEELTLLVDQFIECFRRD